jgi:hypothetical protein
LRKKILAILTISCFSLYSVAQTSTATEMSDGRSLIEAYISPLGNSLGAALNNGWYNTAKPHHLGGFDVTITANLVLVPADAKKFNITGSNTGTFKGEDTPTILGNTTIGEANYDGNKFDMPKGLNIPLLPIPMFQAGIGLIKNTEIDVRFMPEIEMKGVSTDLFGIGVKHDILQWLPIVDKIPIDVSFQAGYTKLHSQVMLKYDVNGVGKNAEAALDIRATTFNILLSKKVVMFTAYAGLGYNSTKTTFNVDGEYNIAGLNFNVNELTEFEFESNNNLRANVGFRLQLTILAIQANYTFSEYPVATVGIGISIR